jgi:hypothetical protein
LVERNFYRQSRRERDAKKSIYLEQAHNDEEHVQDGCSIGKGTNAEHELLRQTTPDCGSTKG